MPKKILTYKISGVPLLAWLLLAACCLAGYWPLSSGLFSLKNDAFVYFLPCRYMISDAIQNGHAPWWNPYFYMGYPLHGDMQSGVWNPIVIIISLFTRYNMSVLHAETLLYMFIAGIGMYKLLQIVTDNFYTKLVIAISYMFCGFVIDTAQITVWTASAACLPFIFLYHFRILTGHENPVKNSLSLALSLYMLMTAGYPSFLIMCCYVLFFAMLANLLSTKHRKEQLIQLLKTHSVAAMAFILLALPAFLSYIDYMPAYQRVAGTTLEESMENPFNVFGLASLIFPFSVTRDHHWLTTNPTSRSLYVGLFSMLLLTGIFRKKISGKEWFIIISVLIIFLFSLGDALPVRRMFYRFIPGMDLFRHPGTMRLFVSIGILLLLAPLMEKCMHDVKQKTTSRYQFVALIFIAAIIVCMLISIPSSSLIKSIFFNGPTDHGSMRDKLKLVYDSIQFSDAVLLESTLQILFLLAFLFMIRKKVIAASRYALLFVLNVMLMAQLSIPHTIVTKKSPDYINRFIKESPKGFPLPDITTSVQSNTNNEKSTNRAYGAAGVYLKKVAWIDEVVNPSHNKNMFTLAYSPVIRNIIFRNPVVYFADTLVRYTDSLSIPENRKGLIFTGSRVSPTQTETNLPNKSTVIINSFEPNRFSFTVWGETNGYISLFQCYNKNWKAFVDGKEQQISTGNISFMYLDISTGKHDIIFEYKPDYLEYAVYISLFGMAMILFILNFPAKRNIIR